MIRASISLRHVQAPKKVLQSNRQKFQSRYLFDKGYAPFIIFIGMPITIACFVQTEQCRRAKYALSGWNGRKNKELIRWSSSLKAFGYKKEFHAMAQFDDIDFIAVRIQHERRDPISQLQCLAGSCNSPNQRLLGLKKPLVR